jgi:hypothetical protein
MIEIIISLRRISVKKHPLLSGIVLFPTPFLRKVLHRLPRALMPAPKNYGFLLGLESGGRVVYNPQDPIGVFGQMTNILEIRKSGDIILIS